MSTELSCHLKIAQNIALKSCFQLIHVVTILPFVVVISKPFAKAISNKLSLLLVLVMLFLNFFVLFAY